MPGFSARIAGDIVISSTPGDPAETAGSGVSDRPFDPIY
jgi:hypothetical protein